MRALIVAVLLLCTTPVIAHSEDQCMASVIYYEANSEPLDGKRSVMDVVLNRAEASGKSVCQVVKAKGQFSWWPSKPIKKYNKDMQKLLTSVKNHPIILIDEKYQYFFRKEIRPKWSRKMKCRVIGSHRFCRLKENKYE